MTGDGLTWEHAHIILNPFPVVLVVAGTAVGLAGWAAGREELERWGVISILLAGALSVPTYLTGLAAADVVGDRTFVEPSLVQTHRAWATWTTVALASAGIFAGFSLAQPEDRRLRRFVLLVGALGGLLVGYSAFLGGRIQHGAEEAGDGRAAATVTDETAAVEAAAYAEIETGVHDGAGGAPWTPPNSQRSGDPI